MGTQYDRLRLNSGQHRRVMAAALLLGLAAFLPVGARLYGLMIRDYEYYANLALRNQTRTTSVMAQRGEIFDRNMNLLASSVTVENVYLDPHELKQSKADIGNLAQTLGEILEKDPAWITEQAGDTRKRYKQVGTFVSEETAAKIRDYINTKNISGIHLEPATRRVYPSGSLAAQVIGFTNSSGDGCEGVEAAYDSYLSGRAGRVITTKGNNEMDMPFSYENYVSARQGDSVILTLDATVQACLEKQMKAAIGRYDVQNGAFGLVMNCKTGEILAMATLGSYDPNNYLEVADPDVAAQLEEMRLRYLSCQPDSEEYLQGQKAYTDALSAARLKQWRNRVLSDGYEPGSTFKVLTMAAALDCGAIDLNTSFHCSGSEQIPGRAQRLHCWRSAGHGAEKTPQALQNSCNIAFAHIALKLGGQRFYEYIEKFGILEKTGIDLAGESKGVFFDKALVTDTDKWGTASLTSGSFGQTFKLTPLQLVRAIASVVNGGNLLEPYIVSEIIDADGNTVMQAEPTVVRQTISKETSDTMRTLIESVVAEGTAKNAKVAGFSIGGKTGTSEKIDVFDENGQRVLDKIVSFVGIAPMNDPEYIVLVALDMTIYNMFPLNRPQVFFLATTVRDDQDVRLVQMQPKSENLDRYTKAFVREYIRHRNEIFQNPNAMHQKWNSDDGAVRIMSTDNVYAEFADTAMFNAIMSEAPSFNCLVNFDGAPMYLASEDAYQTKIRYFCTDNTGQTTPKDYTIKMKLETDNNAQIKWADRVDNPLGLRVSRYEIISGDGDPLDTGFLSE